MRTTTTLALAVVVMIVAAGCSSTRQADRADMAVTYGTYSSLDSTALVYSDPAAMAPLDDHPYRWIAFMLNPLGVVADYGINRPVYSISSTSPGLFGYTSEDAMLHSQRPARIPRR